MLKIYVRSVAGPLISCCRCSFVMTVGEFQSMARRRFGGVCLRVIPSTLTDSSSCMHHHSFTRTGFLPCISTGLGSFPGAKDKQGPGGRVLHRQQDEEIKQSKTTTTMVRMVTQLRAILWKNVLLKRRHWVSTFFEVRV